MSIPLVQNNEKDSINTSIIAIKRNIERINMLLGLSNSEEIDTSEFVKKSDIVDVVEAGNMNPVTSNAVVPVDEVTLGNMHSVTANAVAKALSYSTGEIFTGSYWIDNKKIYKKIIQGNFLFIDGSDWIYTNIGVAELNIESIASMKGFAIATNYIYPIPYVWDNGSLIKMTYQKSQTRIRVAGNATGVSNAPFYVILEYTKTTD